MNNELIKVTVKNDQQLVSARILERNKKTRELEYRIELMSLDDLRKLQKKIGLNLTISFEDDEGTNEVDGIITI
jgi:hypothetical protein